jgi:hypothetical protein
MKKLLALCLLLTGCTSPQTESWKEEAASAASCPAPVTVEVPVEKIVEVPVEKIVKVPVEKIVEVPVEKIVYVTKTETAQCPSPKPAPSPSPKKPKAPKPKAPSEQPSIKAPKQYNHPLDDSDKMVFMMGTDDYGRYLYGEGAIAPGTYKKFLKYVAYYKEQGTPVSRLMMNSPGGSMREGILIGEYLHENNWTTDSDKHMSCYSSCGIIYMGGVKKRMQSGAQVGFHRPYMPGQADTPAFIKDMYHTYKPYWEYVNGSPLLYDEFMTKYDRDMMLVIMAETARQFINVEVY